MIKAIATLKSGQLLAIFGLSRMNTAKLLDGKAILVDLEQLGYPGQPRILLCAGETEAELAHAFEAFIGEGTRVVRYEK